MDWIRLAQDHWRVPVNTVMSLRVPQKAGSVLKCIVSSSSVQLAALCTSVHIFLPTLRFCLCTLFIIIPACCPTHYWRHLS